MSLFLNQTLACPSCAQPVEFDVNFSVNADRRPDFREAILHGQFQVEACEHCGKAFRLEPEISYLDMARGQWLLVRPATRRREWPQLEADARDTWALAYGPHVGAGVRAMGERLTPRVVFGWAALREKLLCVEAGLDDVTLELLKLALMRELPDTPFNADTELRLGAAASDVLSLAWIRFEDETAVETIEVPRSLYDEIVAAPQAWQALRDELAAGAYVDVAKLLVEAQPLPPAQAEEAAPA